MIIKYFKDKKRQKNKVVATNSSNPYIFATQCCITLIFQTMSSVRSNNLSLKYQRLTLSGCSDIRIRKFDIVGGRLNQTRGRI